MSGCENILRADLVKSETLPIFVVPRCRRFTQSQTNIQATANKAGLFFGRFHFGDLDILADFQKGLASFVIYIPQIFVSKMPRCDKNLTVNAQGASTSTVNARKRVESILKLSNEEIANTFSNLTHEQLIELAPLLRVAFCTIECFLNERSSNLEKSKAL